jgi:hypothetical protein
MHIIIPPSNETCLEKKSFKKVAVFLLAPAPLYCENNTATTRRGLQKVMLKVHRTPISYGTMTVAAVSTLPTADRSVFQGFLLLQLQSATLFPNNIQCNTAAAISIPLLQPESVISDLLPNPRLSADYR